MFSRKKKFFVLSIALLCVSCLIFAGCGRNDHNKTEQTPSNSQNETDSQNENNTEQTPDETENDIQNDKNATERTDNTALHQRAEKIANAIQKELTQIKDSRVVISEHMAYVSVSIDETADAEESVTLKEKITNVVKKTDQDIDTVYVMEDADTFTRMKEIAEDVADGHPISGFAEELKNMFVRVTPSSK